MQAVFFADADGRVDSLLFINNHGDFDLTSFFNILASSNYCQDAYNKRFVRDNIVMIDIPVVGPSKVRCDMATQPGGWIIFQRRVDATVDFYLTWADYRGGFGDLHGNFWLGLEKLHRLAAPGKGAKLRVDIKHVDHPSEIRFAEYSLFEISNEANGYRLAVGGYSGNAGDALSYHNNKMFTTRDHDNDSSASNCAISHKGAWWYSDCINSNLNGVFPRDSRDDSTLISWLCCSKSQYGGIIFTEMKLWV